MELLLVRHALPVRLEVAHGAADPGLTAEGNDQSERLANWLGTEDVAALYTSPLRRAIQTAAPVARQLDLQPVVVDELAEWDRDATSYIPIEELRDAGDDLWQALAEGRVHDLGIDVDGFAARVKSAFDSISSRHAGERVVVVCHGGVINCYTAAVLGLDRMLFFQPGYTSISRVLVARSGTRSLHSLNETPHLRADGPA